MGLDYGNTCPKIDKAISEVKNTIFDYVVDLIKDLCPYIPNEKADEVAKDWADSIYNQISDCFEVVRETNEDMRKQANYQIGCLEDEIYSLKDI